jgi:putative lipoic acid-binding regulatory protein
VERILIKREKIGGKMSKFDKLHDLLQEQMTFPDYYTFKFIVKEHKKSEVVKSLSEHSITEKTSKKGTYTSITSRKLVSGPHEIIEIYKEVGKIEGVMTL